MSERQNNNQKNTTKPAIGERAGVCGKCGKSPCVCSKKSDDTDGGIVKGDASSKLRLSKISWI